MQTFGKIAKDLNSYDSCVIYVGRMICNLVKIYKRYDMFKLVCNMQSWIFTSMVNIPYLVNQGLNRKEANFNNSLAPLITPTHHTHHLHTQLPSQPFATITATSSTFLSIFQQPTSSNDYSLHWKTEIEAR